MTNETALLLASVPRYVASRVCRPEFVVKQANPCRIIEPRAGMTKFTGCSACGAAPSKASDVDVTVTATPAVSVSVTSKNHVFAAPTHDPGAGAPLHGTGFGVTVNCTFGVAALWNGCGRYDVQPGL